MKLMLLIFFEQDIFSLNTDLVAPQFLQANLAFLQETFTGIWKM